jgi:hypothetical protein
MMPHRASLIIGVLMPPIYRTVWVLAGVLQVTFSYHPLTSIPDAGSLPPFLRASFVKE